MPQRLAMHTVGAGKWELSINGRPVMTIGNSSRASHVPYSTVLLPASAREALREGENSVAVKRTEGKESDAAMVAFALLAVED